MWNRGAEDFEGGGADHDGGWGLAPRAWFG